VQCSEAQQPPAKQDLAIGSMLEHLEWLDHSEQCALCGKAFEQHHIDYNYEMNHNIQELQMLLDKTADLKHRHDASAHQ
jgi:hypothetical protein